MIRFNGITIDRGWRRIAHRGDQIKFGNRGDHRFRLACTLLLAGPKTARELFDVIYGSEGGPLTGVRLMDTMLCHVRHRLASIGIRVRVSDGGYPKTYWAEVEEMVRLEAAE